MNPKDYCVSLSCFLTGLCSQVGADSYTEKNTKG